jgi:hypothetical protein
MWCMWCWMRATTASGRMAGQVTRRRLPGQFRTGYFVLLGPEPAGVDLLPVAIRKCFPSSGAPRADAPIECL